MTVAIDFDAVLSPQFDRRPFGTGGIERLPADSRDRLAPTAADPICVVASADASLHRRLTAAAELTGWAVEPLSTGSPVTPLGDCRLLVVDLANPPECGRKALERLVAAHVAVPGSLLFVFNAAGSGEDQVWADSMGATVCVTGVASGDDLVAWFTDACRVVQRGSVRRSVLAGNPASPDSSPPLGSVPFGDCDRAEPPHWAGSFAAPSPHSVRIATGPSRTRLAEGSPPSRGRASIPAEGSSARSASGRREIAAAKGRVPSPEEIAAVRGRVPCPEEFPAVRGRVPSPEEIPAVRGRVPSPEEIPAVRGRVPSSGEIPAAPNGASNVRPRSGTARRCGAAASKSSRRLPHSGQATDSGAAPGRPPRNPSSEQVPDLPGPSGHPEE